MVVIYIIAGIIELAMSLWLLYVVTKIWRLLEELMNSGAFPVIKQHRVKIKAREMIDMGYIKDKKNADALSASLRNMKDIEANELADKLDQIIKTQPD